MLNDPSGLFYTFQKALGGEMFGVWTYYLLSPFNLILLVFSDHNLPTAIFLANGIKVRRCWAKFCLAFD
nr:YfhO family protein [Secundilactobacillus odoratitofui]